MHDPAVLVARNAPSYYIWLLSQGVIGVVAGSFGVWTLEGPATWPFASMLVMFALVAGVGVARLLDTRPRIVINAEGIFDRQFGLGVIPWSQIRDAHLLRLIRGKDFIGLDLVNPEQLLAIQPWHKRLVSRANSTLGYPYINAYLTGCTLDTDRVWTAVQQWLAQKRERIMLARKL